MMPSENQAYMKIWGSRVAESITVSVNVDTNLLPRSNRATEV